MAITKKDIEQISEAVEKKIEPYFTAIQEDFNRIYEWQDGFNVWSDSVDGWRKSVDGWRQEVSAKLAGLERRIDHLAEVATQHSKELRAIRLELASLKNSRHADRAKVQQLTERVGALELQAGV